MTNLKATKIEELKDNFRGEVLLPSGDAYESARKIWNAMIDKRPALIVRCATVSDVVRAVNFAKGQQALAVPTEEFLCASIKAEARRAPFYSGLSWQMS